MTMQGRDVTFPCKMPHAMVCLPRFVSIRNQEGRFVTFLQKWLETEEGKTQWLSLAQWQWVYNWSEMFPQWLRRSLAGQSLASKLGIKT